MSPAKGLPPVPPSLHVDCPAVEAIPVREWPPSGERAAIALGVTG